MAVRKGYKLTEVGEIPEDWEVKKLGDIFDISASGDLKKEFFCHFKSDSFPYPIYANSNDNNGLYGYSSLYDVKPPAITITARGNIGYALSRFCNFCAIGRLLILIPKVNLSITYFSNYINFYVNFVKETTGVPQLTSIQASNYLVPRLSKNRKNSPPLFPTSIHSLPPLSSSSPKNAL